MTIDFKDKVAIITGAGGGLGKSHAIELAKGVQKLLLMILAVQLMDQVDHQSPLIKL